MPEEARHLHSVPGGHVVDDQGQLVDQCPGCREASQIISGLEHTIRSLAAKNTQLKDDRAAKVGKNPLWPRAVRLFDIWREATGHTGAKWTTERFEQAEAALKKHDDYWIERAIAGIAYDPMTNKARNGKTVKYDGWETLFKNVGQIGFYANKAPADYESKPRATVTEHAREVAEHLLDRARLITETDDGVAIAQIFVDLDRMNRRWLNQLGGLNSEPQTQLPLGGTDATDHPGNDPRP